MLTGQHRSLNDKQNHLKYDRLGYDKRMSLSKHHKNRKNECDLEAYILIKPNIFNSERKKGLLMYIYFQIHRRRFFKVSLF